MLTSKEQLSASILKGIILTVTVLALFFSLSIGSSEAYTSSKNSKGVELTPGDSNTATIYAHKVWQSAGVILKEGASYTITAEGSWMMGVCGTTDADGTGLNPICTTSNDEKFGWTGSTLIGKIWNKGGVSRGAKAFKVGTHLTLVPDRDGPLYLRAAYLDQFAFVNTGSMKVTVTRTDGYVPPREEIYAKQQMEPQQQPKVTQRPSQQQRVNPPAPTTGDTTPPEMVLFSPRETRGVIINPQQQITVIGFASDTSGIMSVLINGAEAELTPLQDRVNFKSTVTIRPYDQELKIKVFDNYGNISTKTLSFQREVAQPTQTTTRAKPNLWILSIGISQYEDSNLNLQYADNDAKAVAEMMKKQEGSLYAEVNYRLLLNENGTRENILRGISKYLGMASYDDLVLIFMAGHGVKDKQTGSYYFLPYDATPDSLMTRGLLWSTFDEAQKRLASNVSKVMLWLDTCHAGAMKVAMRGAEAGEELSQVLRTGEGTFIIAASKPGEESEESKDYRLEGEKKGHGAFTYAVLKGLKMEADVDHDSSVSISELSSYVAKHVPRITKGRQHPYFRLSGTDVPIFIQKGD